MRKFFLIGLIWLGSALPAAAAAFGSCNHTLEADYIRSGGGHYGSVDCDAVGEVNIGGKTYAIFEYMNSGYGEVTLGAMESGLPPGTVGDIFDVWIGGTDTTGRVDNLADNSHFKITVGQGDDGEGNSKTVLYSGQVKGKCKPQIYDKKGELISYLESCAGEGWSLKVYPKPRDE